LGSRSRIARVISTVAAIAALCLAAGATAAAGKKKGGQPQGPKGVGWMQGFNEPGTPADLNRVGLLKFGRKSAKNVVVFVPGTSAGSAYLAPFASTLVKRLRDWQVWSVERRENLLEDQSFADLAKRGQISGQQYFDYYLGWLNNPNISPHLAPIPDSAVEFGKNWGLAVAVRDLQRVIRVAKRRGGRVVLMGHSLGGSIITAYATWDFGGKPGAKGLSALVYNDGGSNPTPVTAEAAQQSLTNLYQASSSPWISFGGIPAPFAGVFAQGGGIGSISEPDIASRGQASGLLPANLVPPVTVTNLAQFGYAADTETSPPTLFAFQAHVGRLAAAGDPRGWEQAGEITPIERYARMFAGWNLESVDGVAWYHPMRLTTDARAVGNGIANPAQDAIGLRTIHGRKLPKDLRIYAFGAAGGQSILDEAFDLARQSRIPRKQLTLVNRQGTYAHNDPAGAFPRNAFLKNLIGVLNRVAPDEKKAKRKKQR
jgi:hypothetical protein